MEGGGGGSLLSQVVGMCGGGGGGSLLSLVVGGVCGEGGGGGSRYNYQFQMRLLQCLPNVLADHGIPGSQCHKRSQINHFLCAIRGESWVIF